MAELRSENVESGLHLGVDSKVARSNDVVSRRTETVLWNVATYNLASISVRDFWRTSACSNVIVSSV